MNKGGVGHRRHRMIAIIRSRTSTEMKMKITNALVDSPDGDITRVPPRTQAYVEQQALAEFLVLSWAAYCDYTEALFEMESIGSDADNIESHYQS